MFNQLGVSALTVLWTLGITACAEDFEAWLCPSLSPCQNYTDLASALRSARLFPLALVEVREVNDCARLQRVEINTTVVLRGEMIDLWMCDIVNVHSEGNFTVVNSTIHQAEGKASISVLGVLSLENCTVVGWNSSLINSLSGVILIDSTHVFANEAKLLIRLNGSSALVRNTVFHDNQGLIAIDSLANSVSIENCLFLRQAYSLIRATSNSIVFIASCRFENNGGVLFDFAASNATVLIEFSHFSNNSNGGLRLTESIATVAIKSIEWTDNRYPLLWIQSRFSGTIQLLNSTAKGQLAAAAVHIYNTGSAAECKMSIAYSHFLDSEVRAELDSAGVVFAHSCIVTLSHCTIRRVLLVVPAVKQIYGVLTSTLGALALSDVQVSDSGGSCDVVVYFLSSGLVENVDFVNPKINTDQVIWSFGSEVKVNGISITGGNYFSINSLRRSMFMYIFSQISTLTIENITATSTPKFLGAIVGGYGSKIAIDAMWLRRIEGISIIKQMKCDMKISNFECVQCSLNTFAIGEGKNSVAFDNGIIEYSTFSNGIFACAFELTVAFTNCTIRAVSTQYIIAAFTAKVYLKEIEIADSKIDMILRNVIKSTVKAELVYVRNVTGAVINAIGSNVSFEGCILRDLLYGRELIRTDSSKLTIASSRIAQTTSRNLLVAARNSEISIDSCEFDNTTVTQSSLSDITDSQLSISASSFSHYNGTCISGTRSTINLTQVHISDGGYTYEPGSVALYHFGGAVRCVDCPFLALTELQVARTSADLGGALYLAANEAASTVTVAYSLFRECVANSGGVAHFHNVSFRVSDSAFIGSTAERSGGGIDVLASPALLQSIQNCSFRHNSALEGGAIKWRAAQPALLNTTYYNNTAFYGAEVASYGAFIAMKETNSSVAPGQVTNFTFCLIDHYGQQVLTANSQVLVFQPTPKIRFGSSSYKVAEKGEFHIPLIIHATPNSTQTLIGMCDMQVSGTSVSLMYEEEISLRDCEIGEIRSNDTCYLCPAGYYSLELSDKECSVCPTIAFCPGGSRIVPNKDAWMTSNPSNPVLPCPVAGVCMGGEAEQCAAGYEGLLCEHCSEGWFHFVFSTCQRCPHLSIAALEELATFVFWIALVLGLTKLHNKCDQMHQLKLVMEHIQMLGLLAFVRIRYPFPLEVFLHTMLAIASFGSITFPAECLGQGFYTRSIAASVIGSIITFAALIEAIRTFKQTATLPRANVRTVLVSLCSFVPGLSAMGVLPLFSCRSAGASDEHLSIDISEKCWVSTHHSALKYIAIPSLAWNVVLCTVVYAVLLTPSHIADEYSNKCWDLVIFVLKLLTSAAVTLQHGLRGSSQLFFGVFILIVAAVLNSLCIQYKKDRELFVVQFSNFVLLGTYLLALYIPEYESEEAGSIITSALLLLNSVFFIYSLKVILCGYPISRSSVYEIHRQRNNQSNETLIAPQNSVLSEHGVILSIQERASRPSAIITDRKQQ